MRGGGEKRNSREVERWSVGMEEWNEMQVRKDRMECEHTKI